MDEAGDVWYGAQCYIVAYREERQRLGAAEGRQAATDEAVGAHFGPEGKAVQVVHRVQMQALQRMGHRAQAARALEEHRARYPVKCLDELQAFKERGPSAHNEEDTLPQDETNSVAEDSGQTSLRSPSWGTGQR